jgi:hypothetical protein
LNERAATRSSRAAGCAPAAHPGTQAIATSDARVLLANLGFLLVPGPPLDHGAAYLLVAVRPRPTLAHFDPERIEYWALDNGHSVPAEIVWPLPRMDARFSWGTISVADRVGACNQFVSFGGTLAVSRDQELHAALFRSEAPILSLAGRSGPADPLAHHVCAFLARLRGASGYDSPVRTLSEQLTPVALYASFVMSAIDHYRGPNAADSVSPHLISLLRAERHRLEADNPADSAAGDELKSLLRHY